MPLSARRVHAGRPYTEKPNSLHELWLFLAQNFEQAQNLDIKKAQAMPELFGVERSTQLSNQIVKDFKEIADLTYLIPAMEGQIDKDVLLDKEA